MKSAIRLISSLLPFVVIGGLLYAGIFIKPKSVGASVAPPVLSPRDIFYGIAVPTQSVVWAVGQKGKIVRSEDAGKTWVAQKVPLRTNFQSIATWSAQRAIVVGNAGSVLVTNDGGLHWQAVANVPLNAEGQKFLRARAATDGRAWIVGEFGLILSSIDFGATWTSVGKKEDIAWNDLAVGPSAMVAVGEFGRIRRSSDGGKSWSDISSPVKSSLTSVAMRADGMAIAVGLDGVILVSSNEGTSWQRLPSGTAEHLFSVASGPNGWYAVGDQGVYLAAGDDSTIWKSKHFAARYYGWHTDVQLFSGALYVAGKTLSVLAADGNFIHFK